MSVLVAMGVSGSGKTTIARGIADHLHWEMLEGDQLHPPENVEKMRRGIPLTDEDRWPWLHAIAAAIDDWRTRGICGVVACSALKRSYRDILIGDRPDVILVYLQGSRDLIAERLAARKHHYMPSSLLGSQFDTLEEPGPDERPIVESIEPPPEQIVENILRDLQERLP
jgi:gluconokinase